MNASNRFATAIRGSSTQPTRPQDQGARHDRLLPLIAAERGLRCVVLVVIGLVLITHPHTNWSDTISDLARHLGFDPSSNGIQKIIAKIRAISPNKYAVFGVIAIAYGALEGAEAYGLWRRRRWGEYLTVVATSLLFIPEIWEIVKKPSALKAGAIVLNMVIVVYLIVRLRRHGG
ncbi:MAG: DUF2127 domain-containing protein [Solirubrobacteraceae bacterium]